MFRANAGLRSHATAIALRGKAMDTLNPEDIEMDISTEARDLLKAKIKTALQPIFTEALSEIVAEIDPATAIAAHVGSAPAPAP